VLSNAQRGTIVAAGSDHHITPDRENVLAFMRASVTEDAVAP
jgi:hypothetical protein